MDEQNKKRLERLRVLSQPKPDEYWQRLNEIQAATRTIGTIFGIYSVADDTMKQREQEYKELSFEEKRRLLQCEFPDKVSSEKRAEARKRLNFIASNPKLFDINNPQPNSSAKPVVATNIHTSRSWPSSSDWSDDSEAYLKELKGSRGPTSVKTAKTISIREEKPAPKPSSRFKAIKKPMEIDGRFNGTWKIGNYDNFAEIVPPDAATSDTSTVYDGDIPRVSELVTPVQTCVQ